MGLFAYYHVHDTNTWPALRLQGILKETLFIKLSLSQQLAKICYIT